MRLETSWVPRRCHYNILQHIAKYCNILYSTIYCNTVFVCICIRLKMKATVRCTYPSTIASCSPNQSLDVSRFKPLKLQTLAMAAHSAFNHFSASKRVSCRCHFVEESLSARGLSVAQTTYTGLTMVDGQNCSVFLLSSFPHKVGAELDPKQDQKVGQVRLLLVQCNRWTATRGT